MRFDHARVPRATECAVRHDLADGGDGLVEGLGEEHALPGGEAGGLDDLPVGRYVERFDVGYRVVRGREIAILGRGYAVTLEEILRKCLGGG